MRSVCSNKSGRKGLLPEEKDKWRLLPWQNTKRLFFFDWDRSRAWYMDIAGSRQDFIYGISKKNQKIFKVFIKRDDPIYLKGKEKYDELAFRWWMLIE